MALERRYKFYGGFHEILVVFLLLLSSYKIQIGLRVDYYTESMI